MRRSPELSNALFETKLTLPPMESPSMSGVGDLTTSIRSTESEPTVWNWNSRLEPAEAASAMRLPSWLIVLRFWLMPRMRM